MALRPPNYNTLKLRLERAPTRRLKLLPWKLGGGTAERGVRAMSEGAAMAEGSERPWWRRVFGG